MQLRNDSPVWEKGYTFLLSNPEHDSVQIRIVDQKTEKDIGQYTFPLSGLLDKPGMEIASQPYQLAKSGAESKIELAFRLRILKKSPNDEDEQHALRSGSVTTIASAINVTPDPMSRTNSVRAQPSPSPVLRKQDSKLSTHSYGGGESDLTATDEEPILSTLSKAELSSSPPNSTHSSELSESIIELLHRAPSVTSSAGSFGLGRIQLTLRYSVQRQRLIVIIHKIM